MALTFDSLAEVALARDLLRRWWGLELGLAEANGNGYARQSHATCATLHAKGPACDSELRAIAAELAKGSAATAHVITRVCHAGLTMIAAPVWGTSGLAAVVYATGARHGVGTGDVAAHISRELSVAPAEAEAMAAVAPALDGTGLPRPGSAAEWQRGVIDGTGSPRPGSAAEWQRGVLDELQAARDLVSAAAAAVERAQPVVLPPTTFVHPFTEIVGEAPAVREVIKLLTKVVKSEATVLIHGESGTGKELIARAIHYHGPRSKKPFVVQNCSAFNDNLLESALFGHVRGAFTGAVKDNKGLFEVADGGTFFLDEIGDMSAALQVKLLRVLQEGTLTPVGGTKPIKVDVRIIAASHKDLATMVAHKQFREDLFYRVNVLKITVPPLRERAADIPRLAQFFIGKHWGSSHRPGIAPRLTPSAIARLVAHTWPGNIRELENEIERMLVLAGDAQELTGAMVSSRLSGAAQHGTPRTLRDALAVAETDTIVAALGRHAGDRDAAATDLGTSRALLDARATALGLDHESPR